MYIYFCTYPYKRLAKLWLTVQRKQPRDDMAGKSAGFDVLLCLVSASTCVRVVGKLPLKRNWNVLFACFRLQISNLVSDCHADLCDHAIQSSRFHCRKWQFSKKQMFRKFKFSASRNKLWRFRTSGARPWFAQQHMHTHARGCRDKAKQ